MSEQPAPAGTARQGSSWNPRPPKPSASTRPRPARMPTSSPPSSKTSPPTASLLRRTARPGRTCAKCTSPGWPASARPSPDDPPARPPPRPDHLFRGRRQTAGDLTSEAELHALDRTVVATFSTEWARRANSVTTGVSPGTDPNRTGPRAQSHRTESERPVMLPTGEEAFDVKTLHSCGSGASTPRSQHDASGWPRRSAADATAPPDWVVELGMGAPAARPCRSTPATATWQANAVVP